MIWTVLELLRSATTHLAEHGAEDARLDAELLLARVLGCDRVGLYVAHDRPVGDEDRAAFRELVRRRSRGEPVAYILGQREFHGLSFQVDRRCLVPRPETEHLVDEAVRRLRSRPPDAPAPRILDLGTGSGCIAVSLAREFPGAHVTAVDLAPEALEVARRNAQALVPDALLRFLEGDLFSPVPPGESWDLVLSNPPYIGDAEWGDLPTEVRAFEPPLALRAGPDPWIYYDRILGGVRGRMSPGGAVILELPGDPSPPVGRWSPLLAPETPLRVLADLAGRPRVLVAG